MNTLSLLALLIVGIFVIFFGMLFYRLFTDRKWFDNFLDNKLEDKDAFTQIVKFLMS
jgi:H+/Cl- antiporter ClcA